MSGGVLGFPLFTLLLIAFDPFVGLGIESFRILVVAVLVILGGHAVEGRIKVLGSGVNGIVGLLEGQGDAATVQIHIDHLDEDGLARLDHSLGVFHVAVGQLGDMDEAFDAVINGDEDTELNDFGDLAPDDLSRNMGARETLPRIFLGGLEGEGDALAVEIDVEHLHGDLVSDLHDLGWMIDVLP